MREVKKWKRYCELKQTLTEESPRKLHEQFLSLGYEFSNVDITDVERHILKYPRPMKAYEYADTVFGGDRDDWEESKGKILEKAEREPEKISWLVNTADPAEQKEVEKTIEKICQADPPNREICKQLKKLKDEGKITTGPGLLRELCDHYELPEKGHHKNGFNQIATGEPFYFFSKVTPVNSKK